MLLEENYYNCSTQIFAPANIPKFNAGFVKRFPNVFKPVFHNKFLDLNTFFLALSAAVITACYSNYVSGLP